MKTIVVPTDFSKVSLNAVKYAADMACVLNTSLSLLHVVGVPKNFIDASPPIYNVSELIEDAEKELNELRDKILTRTEDRIRISVKAIVGEVVSAIADHCEGLNTYTIVMGAETTGPVERLIFGGKTVSSVRRLSWPLIVVPDKARFRDIRKIALACDFREVVETIPVKEIGRLVNACSAELYVIHVSPENRNAFNREIDEEAGWLHEMIGRFEPKHHFIEGTDVEKGIIEFADKNDLDLLIVIPKKHNLVKKLFRRSHSKQLVLQSHVPVMAIHE